MARIRSIKPDYWKSEDIAKLSRSARLTFIALWSYVDDNGVGRDNERLITAEIYPLEDDPVEALAIVHRDLDELARGSRVVRYTVGDKAYIHVVNWEKHQKIDRPNKPRYPLPSAEGATILTCEDVPPKPESDGHARDTRAIPCPGAVDQGTEEQRNVGDETPDAPPRTDVETLCRKLSEHVEANTSRRPAVTGKWRTEARLLLDRDGRPLGEALRVLAWSQGDEFWRANILSMPKFREKYDQLKLQSERGNGNGRPRIDPTTTQAWT